VNREAYLAGRGRKDGIKYKKKNSLIKKLAKNVLFSRKDAENAQKIAKNEQKSALNSV
jgi:hypothetical protein